MITAGQMEDGSLQDERKHVIQFRLFLRHIRGCLEAGDDVQDVIKKIDKQLDD